MEEASPFTKIFENYYARKSNLNTKLEAASKDKIFNITDFTKTILLMSSTILAVLISLYNKKVVNFIEMYSFISTIVLFTLNILFGTIALYVGVVNSIGVETLILKELVKMESEISTNTKGELNKPNMFYARCWTIFKITSILSLLSMLLYTISKVFGI